MNDKAYDFPPFRPPSEAESLLVRVTRGCPWNRCTFCPMYKGVKFETRTAEAVKADIDTAETFTNGRVRTVFVGDSDSLVSERRTICEVMEQLYTKFPAVERVTSYARAQTLRRKSVEALAAIRAAGLTRLHIGLETGSEHLLKRIQKGAGPETMVSGVNKAKQAGFEISLYVLLGIGGVTDSFHHAVETAALINRMAPDYVRVRTLAPQPGTGLYEQWQEGEFELPGPEVILKEQRSLIERLDVRCEYLSDHVSNYVPVNGMLPVDKPAMISMLDDTLERFSADEAFKKSLDRMPYLRRL